MYEFKIEEHEDGGVFSIVGTVVEDLRNKEESVLLKAYRRGYARGYEDAMRYKGADKG